MDMNRYSNRDPQSVAKSTPDLSFPEIISARSDDAAPTVRA
jgi:hypothetical protein